MNIHELHQGHKMVSAQTIFRTSEGSATSIRITENGLLKEHITKTPALLLCISGRIVYEDENGVKTELKSGDYYQISPMVKHWLKGIETSQIILIK